MWFNGKLVLQTFASNNAQNAWALIDGVGAWRQIKTGATDGVTNLFILFNAAKANGRTVNVFVDGSNFITMAYMN